MLEATYKSRYRYATRVEYKCQTRRLELWVGSTIIEHKRRVATNIYPLFTAERSA